MPHRPSRASVNAELFPRFLASIYRTAHRIEDPDFALAQDPDIYEKLDRDAVVKHAKQIRKHDVAGKRWMMEPGDKSDEAQMRADIEAGWVDSIPRFRSSLRNLAEAFWRGVSIAHMPLVKKKLALGDGVERTWIVPEHLKDIDKRSRRIIPVTEGDRVKIRLEIASPIDGQFRPPKRPERFIIHLYDNTADRFGHGHGLADACYFYASSLMELRVTGVKGAKRWAEGFLIAKIERGAKAEDGRPNTTVQRLWREALQVAQANHILTMDKEDEVEVLDGPQTAGAVVELMNWHKEAITQLILSSVLPSGGGADVGSNARAEVEDKTSDKVKDFDRALLSETLNLDMMGLLRDMNRPQLRSMGLDRVPEPELLLLDGERVPSIEDAQALSTMGYPLSKRQLADVSGWDIAEEPDDILEAPEAAPVPGGGLFG